MTKAEHYSAAVHWLQTADNSNLGVPLLLRALTHAVLAVGASTIDFDAYTNYPHTESDPPTPTLFDNTEGTAA